MVKKKIRIRINDVVQVVTDDITFSGTKLTGRFGIVRDKDNSHVSGVDFGGQIRGGHSLASTIKTSTGWYLDDMSLQIIGRAMSLKKAKK